MKLYVNRCPPGFSRVPPHPVLVLSEEEARNWRAGWPSIRREAHERAERILQRHGYYSRVAICDESGQELQVISREE